MQSYEFLSIFSRYNFVNLHSNLKITLKYMTKI